MMGNLCGKQSSHRDDYFASPGRTLGNANANAGEARKASIPRTTYTTGQNQTPNQGRTVGRAGGGLSSTASGAGSDAQNPRAAAARAAEERAKRNQADGKLAKQLDAQKKKTVNATLEQVSRENRAARDADEAAETRNYA